MSFEVTILGSSSALPTLTRFPTAHLLNVNERYYLIDCGEGAQIQLRKFKLNPLRIHHVFISHMHGDHIFGLFGLISTLGLMGRKKPLFLYGPERLKEFIDRYSEFFDAVPFDLVIHHPVSGSENLLFEDQRITVEALSLDHRTTTFGYLFREKSRLLNIRKDQIEKYNLGIEAIARIKQGQDHTLPDGRVIPNSELTLPPYHQRSYAYISDTKYKEALIGKITGVDLLYHEATFSESDAKLAEETWHSTAKQAASMAVKAKVRKLLIGHFSSRYTDAGLLVDEAREIFPETVGVNDGDRFSLPGEREPRR